MMKTQRSDGEKKWLKKGKEHVLMKLLKVMKLLIIWFKI